MTTAAVAFLTALARALATLGLYADDHPAAERSSSTAFLALEKLLREDPAPAFSFVDHEVFYRQRVLRAAEGLGLAERLREIGVQRIEFDPSVSERDFETFLDEVKLRFASSSPLPAWSGSRRGVRFGAVGLREEADEPKVVARGIDLVVEVDAVRRLHDDARTYGRIDVALAEGIVRVLALTLRDRSDARMALLLPSDHHGYHATHAINTALLTIASAELSGMVPHEAHAFGVAGLLHDIGMLLVPESIIGAGRALTADEQVVVRRHVVDGTRLALASDPPLELAAVVSYEHQMAPIGGYPERRPRREPHVASRLVRVCSVYDALTSPRPWGDSWESVRALAHLNRETGTEFDPDAVAAIRELLLGVEVVRIPV